ncbi:hypothetical protein J7J18_06755 [bacterium]|nr:hypothetical protein [bacterium]
MEWLEAARKSLKCATSTLDTISQDERGYLPSGVLPLDYVTGAPGFPLGRVVEIFGLESVGKSAIVAALLGSAHVLEGTAVLADTEHAYTNDWARLFCVSPEKLLVVNPEHVQEAVETFKTLCTLFKKHPAPPPRIFAWDSIAATPVLEEIDDDLSDKAAGLHARLLSKGLRQLTTALEDLNILFVATNQQKEKISIWGASGVSKIGGHAFDFHSCLQLQLKRVSLIPHPERKNEVVGMKLSVTAVKNKIYRPYLTAPVTYYFDSGFDDTEFVTWFAKETGILKDLGGGGWKEFKGEKFQGTPPVEIFSEIEKLVVETYYGPLANTVLQLRNLRTNQVLLSPKWRKGDVSHEDGVQTALPGEESSSDTSSDASSEY